VTRTADLVFLLPLGALLLRARRSAALNRLGPAAKYVLWAPVIASRLLWGDRILSWGVW